MSDAGRAYRRIVRAVKVGEVSDLQRGHFYALGEDIAFRVGDVWVRQGVATDDGAVWLARAIDGPGDLVSLNGRRLRRALRGSFPDFDFRDRQHQLRDILFDTVRRVES